jgi:hypothetical protein
MSSSGLLTYLEPPKGNAYIEVDLTPFAYPGPVAEARYLQAQAKADHVYPQYHLLAIKLASFRGVPEGTWRFHWQQAGIGRTGVLQVLFTLKTAAGKQPYDLTVSAPAVNFGNADAIFQKALRTFKPLP